MSTASAASGSVAPCSRSRARSGTPLTSSMTMAAPPPSWMYSHIVAMWGWRSVVSSRASDWNLATAAGSPSSRGARYLIATLTPVSSCTASTTRPPAPAPSCLICV
ncbi:hypothetical protein MF672_001715 [Actinomadura sp. ATCC 31491]|uniref:Uncharacterized protein n=1 Tax=Actinomadura luzonensis TaxID=2805427 RepID=A0ABT0FJZ6_9ACTN|nr:hypothetical protein [Actinomadura luzonensis]MCK2212523.1 hypothetical protein [Actinomadura luzonensis]